MPSEEPTSAAAGSESSTSVIDLVATRAMVRRHRLTVAYPIAGSPLSERRATPKPWRQIPQGASWTTPPRRLPLAATANTHQLLVNRTNLMPVWHLSPIVLPLLRLCSGRPRYLRKDFSWDCPPSSARPGPELAASRPRPRAPRIATRRPRR